MIQAINVCFPWVNKRINSIPRELRAQPNLRLDEDFWEYGQTTQFFIGYKSLIGSGTQAQRFDGAYA